MESNSSRSTIFTHNMGALTPNLCSWPTSPAAPHYQQTKAIMPEPVAAMAKLEGVYDDLEAVICGEALLAASDSERSHALSHLQSVADLSDKQVFHLRARAALHTWLAQSCSHLSPSLVQHLSDLTHSLQVESHSNQSIGLPQCRMGQRGSVISLHHGFQTGPSEVTVQLRVSTDFRHSSQRPGTTSEQLSLGVDVEWQIQGLDDSAGPPAVGALSLPSFLIVGSGGCIKSNQAPDLEQLSRLQGMFQCSGLSPTDFLGFLLALALAPDPVPCPGASAQPCSERAASMDCSYRLPGGGPTGSSSSSSHPRRSDMEMATTAATKECKTIQTEDDVTTSAFEDCDFEGVSASHLVRQRLLSDEAGALSDDSSTSKRRRTNGERKRRDHPVVDTWARSLALMQQSLNAAFAAAESSEAEAILSA